MYHRLTNTHWHLRICVYMLTWKHVNLGLETNMYMALYYIQTMHAFTYFYRNTNVHLYIKTTWVQTYNVHQYIHLLVLKYNYTYMHTYINTNVNALIHTYIYTHMYTYAHAYIHIHVCTGIMAHACILKCIDKCLLLLLQSNLHVHITLHINTKKIVCLSIRYDTIRY